VCALDLLSGLAEGLEESIESLVSKYDAVMLGLLFQCVQDLDPDVRQSAFALLGDLAKTCMGHLRPHLDKFLPIAARNLNPQFFSVCNNASWSIGEIAVKAGGDSMAPFVHDILLYLSPILKDGDPDMMRSLLENASITIGRLAFVCPAQVAPHLDVICKKWLLYLAPLKENTEKEHAFKGLSLVIGVNPQAIWHAHAFPDLLSAIASWTEPSAEMANIFHQLLHSYKNSLGPQWQQAINACEPAVRQTITQRYQL
jgi:transportin-1